MATKTKRTKRIHRDRVDPQAKIDALLLRAEQAGKEERWADSVAIVRQALTLDPDSLPAKAVLGSLLASWPSELDDLQEAYRVCKHLVARMPASPNAHFRAALACYKLGLDSECQPHLNFAYNTMPPDNQEFALMRLLRAGFLLRTGDYARGWPEYTRWNGEATRRRGRNIFRRFCPTWDGSDPAGRKLLLHTICDGYGDAIMMARYLPMVRAAHPGATILLLCPESIAHLLSEIMNMDRDIDGVVALPEPFTVRHDGFDGFLEAPLMSLPTIFGTTLDTIPAQVPYLSASTEAIAKWKPVVEAISGLRVGITWQGLADLQADCFRSIVLKEFAPLAEIPGVSLIALQKGFGREQIASCGFEVVDLGDAYRDGDWSDTVAIVSQLDLIISPDTSVAHLAGALAKPTWIALPTPSEWRWMRDREDSPWYPTAKLWRQTTLGEWGPVFQRMADALRARLQHEPTIPAVVDRPDPGPSIPWGDSASRSPLLQEAAAAMRLIYSGDLARGLPLLDRCNDVIRDRLKLPALRQPKWRGEPLEGRTIMVHTHTGGHGDVWQQARFLPELKRRGARVVVCCTNTQARLLAQAEGADQVVAASIEEPCEAWGLPWDLWAHDFQLSIDSLPAALGVTMATLPGPISYLAPDTETVERWRPSLEAVDGLKVGIAWAGNPTHGNDAQRSFKLSELAPLAAVPGISLVSIQAGHGVEQLRTIDFPVVELGPEYADGDWLSTAGVIAGLDLVVTPDSALAHLAGSMGKETWMALQTPCDCRWMRDPDSSPWYTAMTLFRQSRPGDWPGVFARMAVELRDRLVGPP